MSKTKKVSGISLGAECFAYVRDKSDGAGWRFPIYFPGNQLLTANHIKNALSRFGESKIPKNLRQKTWDRIVGAAMAYGITVPAELEETYSPQNAIVEAEENIKLPVPLDAADLEEEERDARNDRVAEKLLNRWGINI
jgi:hypothetical protein